MVESVLTKYKLMRIALTLSLVFIVSCAGLQSRYYEVKSGDSLAQIAKKYDVPLKELNRWNAPLIAKGVRAGSKLYIPYESSPSWNKDLMEEGTAATAEISHDKSRDVAAVNFSWPVSGLITSPFGPRKNERHEGIDIRARKGVLVHASRGGHVIYAGNTISGYGNMVIVRHADSFSTVYAHLSKIDVKKNQYVARGQTVGKVGMTGRATGPHLHFEIRDASVAVNPLLYLHGQYANNMVR